MARGAQLLLLWREPCRSEATSVDDLEQDDDDRDHQQDVDEAADGGRGRSPEQPQDEQYDGDGVEHGILRSLRVQGTLSSRAWQASVCWRT